MKLIIVFTLFFTINCYAQKQLPNGYKICLIGDTGTGNKEQIYVAKALEQENCDQVRVLGDVIYEDGIKSSKDEQLKQKFLAPYNNLLKNIPFYISLGNHDYRSNPASWLEVAKEHENIHFPSMYYSDVYEDICLYTLDTNSSFKEQIIWMGRQILINSTCKFNLSLGHHPFISSGMHKSASGSLKDFLEQTAIKHTHAYFAGHDHQLSDEGKSGKTHLFISGSGAKLRPLSKNAQVWGVSKLGYMTLVVQRSKKEVKLKFDFISVNEKFKRKVEHSGFITR